MKRDPTNTPMLYFKAGVNFLNPKYPSPLMFDEDLCTKKLNKRGFVEVPNCEIIQSEIEAMEEQLVEEKRLVREERCRMKGKQRESPTPVAPTNGRTKRKHKLLRIDWLHCLYLEI